MTKLEILHLIRANLVASLANLDVVIAAESETPAPAPAGTCPNHPSAPVRTRQKFGGDVHLSCGACGEEIQTKPGG